ncbi:unnamed protein product [Pedinophyceae sp. YPF-701]|nr:unnamed protein product [Pedinophyceae sp. YPF-701]
MTCQRRSGRARDASSPAGDRDGTEEARSGRAAPREASQVLAAVVHGRCNVLLPFTCDCQKKQCPRPATHGTRCGMHTHEKMAARLQMLQERAHSVPPGASPTAYFRRMGELSRRRREAAAGRTAPGSNDAAAAKEQQKKKTPHVPHQRTRPGQRASSPTARGEAPQRARRPGASWATQAGQRGAQSTAAALPALDVAALQVTPRPTPEDQARAGGEQLARSAPLRDPAPGPSFPPGFVYVNCDGVLGGVLAGGGGVGEVRAALLRALPRRTALQDRKSGNDKVIQALQDLDPRLPKRLSALEGRLGDLKRAAESREGSAEPDADLAAQIADVEAQHKALSAYLKWTRKVRHHLACVPDLATLSGIDPTGDLWATGHLNALKRCHQCRTLHVASYCSTPTCTTSYCGACLAIFYPGWSHDSVDERCLACRGVCNCVSCLRAYTATAHDGAARPTLREVLAAEQHREYASYLVRLTRPVLGGLLDAQRAALPDGVRLESVPLVRLDGERLSCDRCRGSISCLLYTCAACADDSGGAFAPGVDAVTLCPACCAKGVPAAGGTPCNGCGKTRRAFTPARLLDDGELAELDAVVAEERPGDARGRQWRWLRPVAYPAWSPYATGSIADADARCRAVWERLRSVGPAVDGACAAERCADATQPVCAPTDAATPPADVPEPADADGAAQGSPGGEARGADEPRRAPEAAAEASSEDSATLLRMLPPGRDPAEHRLCALRGVGDRGSAAQGSDNFLFCPDASELDLFHHNRQRAVAIFQEEHAAGRPVIVRGVRAAMSWAPATFGRGMTQAAAGDASDAAEDHRVAVLDCATWEAAEEDEWDFFAQYVKNDPAGPMHKVKDYPPGRPFSTVFPRHYQDFVESLPMPEYTHPEHGPLNMYCALPQQFLPPDIGPKTYIAFGRPPEAQTAPPAGGVETALRGRVRAGTIARVPERVHVDGDSVTKLHLDMADAVNVLMHCQLSADGSDKKTVPEPRVGARTVRDRTTFDGAGAVWDIFRREDVPKLKEYIAANVDTFTHGGRPASRAFVDAPGGAGSGDAVLNQHCMLVDEDRRRLQEEFGVEPWTIEQYLGEAIFVPAGCPHQVRNLRSCLKIAVDFVSPESAAACHDVARQLRSTFPGGTRAIDHEGLCVETGLDLWREDKLQGELITYKAIIDSRRRLKGSGTPPPPPPEGAEEPRVRATVPDSEASEDEGVVRWTD